MTRRAPSRPGGVYAAPGNTTALRAGYTGPLDLWRTLDLSAVRDKRSLLAALARVLDFPAHFGHNWDALNDSLQDLSWLQWSRMTLEINAGDALRRHAPQDWNTALDIFRTAATYWAAHGKSFTVLVHGASELPALGA